jgi:membrane protein
MVGILDILISLVLASSLFALVFRYMPARRLPWKIVACGGLLTAILFDIGRWAIGLYLARSTQPTACLGGLRTDGVEAESANRN